MSSPSEIRQLTYPRTTAAPRPPASPHVITNNPSGHISCGSYRCQSFHRKLCSSGSSCRPPLRHTAEVSRKPSHALTSLNVSSHSMHMRRCLAAVTGVALIQSPTRARSVGARSRNLKHGDFAFSPSFPPTRFVCQIVLLFTPAWCMAAPDCQNTPHRFGACWWRWRAHHTGLRAFVVGAHVVLSSGCAGGEVEGRVLQRETLRGRSEAGIPWSQIWLLG
ncbi:hypothetical protein BCR34DRAFT_246388 [Clohesyomyces aquaticus]|uniref:Uncharacterized protein n=1 Tax=Clohesyomyces aquaticus TaxID=1231657 RepID=A0A1Y1ZV33_9PLEO|nr:hypothetical protein BCR34DRAFT_246388 [Clohesyomyces aquaticus]